MNKNRRRIALLLSLWMAAFTSQAATTIDPATKWQSLHTAHFTVHYHLEETALAQRVARQAEAVHARLSPIFDWTPREPTQILLTDRNDFANGSADIIPRDSMTLLVTPPDHLEQLSDYDDWMFRLLMHEYTHVLHLDSAAGAPERWRGVIGRLFFLFPNQLQAHWVIEGLATYMETDRTLGVGRGQSSLFQALMRVEVSRGIKPLAQVSMPLSDWPEGTADYLYGVYFFNFLRDTYGEESIQRWIRNYSDNLLPFAMNSNARQSFQGKDLHQLWAEYSDYIQRQFQPQIQAIKDQGADRSQRLSQDGFDTGYPQTTSAGDVYYVRNDALLDSQLLHLRPGASQPETLGRFLSNDFDVHPQAGIIYTQLDYTHSTNLFSDIYHLDLATGIVRQLSSGERYRYVAWMPDGKQLIAVQNQLGNKALHLLNDKGERVSVLWQGENNEVIGQPHVAPDGQRLVAAVWRPDTQWNLEEFSLLSGHWRHLTQNTEIETSPRYTADGNAVVFSADYDGVFNLYRLDLRSGELQRLSNVLGGIFTVSRPTADGSLYYTGLHSGGMDLYRLAAADQLNQVVPLPNSQAQIPEPLLVELSTTYISDYQPQILPTAWFPFYTKTDAARLLSVSTFGRDVLRRHQYNLSVDYDLDQHWLAGRFDYLYDRWNPSVKIHADREILRELDTQGQTSAYRNNDQLDVELIWPFVKRDWQWGLHLGWLHNTESDKRVVESATTYPSINSELLGLGVSYNSARQRSRAISLNQGQRWRFNLEDYDNIDSTYSGQVYNLDWNGYFALGGAHVLHTRAALGWANQQPRPFRLGGYNDNRSVSSPLGAVGDLTSNSFNRRSYALLGYPEGLASLRGRRMLLTELDWRFPIATIERTIITPPLGVERIHGRLLYCAGNAWDDNRDANDLLQSVGTELYGEFKLGYRFDINLRLGYAYGLNEGGESQGYMQLSIPFFGNI